MGTEKLPGGEGKINQSLLLSSATTTGAGDLIKLPKGSKDFWSEMSGTGAISATVKIYGSRSGTKDNLHLVATLTLSGTNTAADRHIKEECAWIQYYADLTAISGTGASLNCGALY